MTMDYFQRCICIEGDWDFNEFPPYSKEFFICVLNTLEKQILYVDRLLPKRRMKMAHFRTWVQIMHRSIRMMEKCAPVLKTARNRRRYYIRSIEVLHQRVALLRLIAFCQ